MTDYPGAIWFPAHPTNMYDPAGHGGVINAPRAFVIHTPEEKADGYPATPHWFAQEHPDRAGSTHYFVSFTGDTYQCVPEAWGAIANGFNPGNPQQLPYPSWAGPFSLNWQTLSVEAEGYADSIQDTLVAGSVQWNALVELVRDRCEHYAIPLTREHIIGHYEVSTDRSDPGAGFPWDEFIRALNEEDDVTERVWDGARTWIVGKGGSSLILYPDMDKPLEAIYGPHSRVMSPADLEKIKV